MAAPHELVIPAKAGIQYAAAFRFILTVSGILDRPPEPVVQPAKKPDRMADDEG
jgi:hypothetical protein